MVSSDEIVHHLIRTDPEIKAAMLERLGDGILGEDGEIDRARVGQVVFGDREALAWLEGLLHPRVSAEYLNWREQLAKLPGAPAVCVTEVPLLYEVGAQDRFDKVVAITAPRALREQRTNVPMEGREERLLDDREKVEARGLRLREHRRPDGARRLGRGRHGRAASFARICSALTTFPFAVLRERALEDRPRIALDRDSRPPRRPRSARRRSRSRPRGSTASDASRRASSGWFLDATIFASATRQ